MEKEPNSFNDFEVLNAQMMGLADQVKAMSARIKSNTEHLNDHHVERLDERINSIDREMIVLKMSLEALTNQFNDHRQASDRDISDIYAELAKHQEKLQELQGEISQVRLQMSKSDEERLAKKNRILTSFLYPILAGAALMLIGYIFKSFEFRMFNINNNGYTPPSQQVEK